LLSYNSGALPARRPAAVIRTRPTSVARPPGDDALGRRTREPGARQFDHLRDGEAVREHDRFGAAVARRGEQFKRGAAVGLWAATRAAICLRLIFPSSGNRAMSVKASTGPTPGIEVSSSDWSTKLIRGLTSEAAAGIQSRRGLNHDDSAPVTPHNAPFPTDNAVYEPTNRAPAA